MDTEQLSRFRTGLCVSKCKAGVECNGEDCPYSHCVSWTRRNPYKVAYKSKLCPNTKFWQENNRLRVKTWCKNGRTCKYSHTKEEQMYHPAVYKTQTCKFYPNCHKQYCPFAHGVKELRFVLDCETSEAAVSRSADDVKPAFWCDSGCAGDEAEFDSETRLVDLLNNLITRPQQPALQIELASERIFCRSALTASNVKILQHGVVAVKLLDCNNF